MTHYGLTIEEFASKNGKDKSCYSEPKRLRALCGNGNYHAITTREKNAVDCQACLAKLSLPQKG